MTLTKKKNIGAEPKKKEYKWTHRLSTKTEQLTEKQPIKPEARKLKKKEFVKCPVCGIEAEIFVWNYPLRMSLCNNINCAVWHHPVNPDPLVLSTIHGGLIGESENAKA